MDALSATYWQFNEKQDGTVGVVFQHPGSGGEAREEAEPSRRDAAVWHRGRPGNNRGCTQGPSVPQ